MKQTYKLIKLKTKTVLNLKRLMIQSGKVSLDDFINSMIQVTKTHRLCLQEIGWEYQGGKSEI